MSITMLLALDTATPACTAALFGPDGSLLAQADEVMARGSAERLMPMLEHMLGSARPTSVLVGCGPGSFTGLRVGLAAAHGLSLGWGATLHAMPTLALIAAGALGTEPVAIALLGGHGELFVQQFTRRPLAPVTDLASLSPEAAAQMIDAPARPWLRCSRPGRGARLGRGTGASSHRIRRSEASARTSQPGASSALRPSAGRQGQGCGMSSTAPHSLTLSRAGGAELDEVMEIVARAFDPRYGEAWTRAQCAGILPMSGVILLLGRVDGKAAGFSLSRPCRRRGRASPARRRARMSRRGIAGALVHRFVADSAAAGAKLLHLEVRDGNPAVSLYRNHHFTIAGRRHKYYRGPEGEMFDALTMVRKIS
jgi:tRNA threonylcarbamoyl adenosine modification protein YeaZ